MKKLSIALAALGMVLLVNNAAIAGKPAVKPAVTVVSEDNDWEKAKDGTWPGAVDSKTQWYKLDKDAKLWTSTDGKKWEDANGQRWADKDGRWLMINNRKLVVSTDMGVSWTEVPEWKWQGSNGSWYKFDKDFNLWVKK